MSHIFYFYKEISMTYKLKALLLAIVSIIFMTGGIASTETIDIVSDTAYAPFEFKDSDQVYKGIDVDIINEVAKRKLGTIT